MLTTLARLRMLALLLVWSAGCSDDSNDANPTASRNPSQVQLVVPGENTWAGGAPTASASGAAAASAAAGDVASAGNRGTGSSAAGNAAGGRGGAPSAGGSGGSYSNLAGTKSTLDVETAALLKRLQATLEIVFGQEGVPITPNCDAVWAGTRGYITIASPYCNASSDWCNGASFTEQAYMPSYAKLTLKPNGEASIILKGFSSRWAQGANTELVDLLTLDYDADGLTGTGVATMKRSCVGQADLVYDLAVTLGPDRHRPVVVVDPSPQLAPYAVSWGEFRVKPSEKLFVGGDAADYASLIGVVNYDDPTKVATVVPRPSMWPAIGFADPAEVAGTRQRIFLRTAATDAFGNFAVADPSPIEVVDDSLLTDIFDFDVFEPKGLIGAARYVAPGSVDSPCESGGCIVLGPAVPCAPDARSPFFSFRIATNDHVNIKIRSAIYSDVPATGDAHPVVVDSVQYMYSLADWGTSLTESTAAGPEFGYASGFFDQSVVTQSNAATGAALAFTCDGTAVQPKLLWVIERLELEHDAW